MGLNVKKKKQKPLDKESAYLLQLIDCNCNDCAYLTRNLDKTNESKQRSLKDGLHSSLNYGSCSKLNKNITFIPNICQIETQDCFKHRKDE